MSRHWAEQIAKTHLEHQGYSILAENYAIRGGEIDLIAYKEGWTIFVEVKQRANRRYGSAAESISLGKMQRLHNTALHFMLKHYERDDLPMRFDAILLSGTATDYSLEHLENISL